MFWSEKIGIESINIKKKENIDEEISKKIKENKDEVYRFFISSELASFSSDIYGKYKNSKNVKIVIS